MTSDEAVRSALRDFRSDVSDIAAFAKLVVAFWRAALHESDKRPLQIQFTLHKLAESKATTRSKRTFQSHLWSKSKGNSRGFWWTVGPGNWREPDGRAWIVPCTDAGWQTWSNADYSKPFGSIGELVDYMVGRAAEWRVVEKKVKART